MFHLEKIREAHSKVKSGADFPAYVQELKKIGVKSYDSFVNDGHTVYYGENNFTLQSPARYMPMEIAGKSDKEKLEYHLKMHQQGQTSYPIFCQQAAACGIEKWTVDIWQATCTYFDGMGNKVLEENIP